MGARFTVRLDDDSLAEWVNSEADDRDRPKAWVIAEAVRAAKGEESTYAHRGGADGTVTHQPDSDGIGAERTGEHRSGAGSTTESGAGRTDAHRDGADSSEVDVLRERVDDLEERLAELEARESARDELAGDRYAVSDAEEDDQERTDESHAVPPRGNGRDQPSDAPSGPSEDESEKEDGTSVAAEGDLDNDVLEALREFVEDRPPHKAHAKRAAVETVLVLREHGTLSTGDLQDAVYEEVAEEYTDARTMWNSLSRYVEDIPGVEKAGYGEWGYAGDDALRELLDNR